MENKNMIYVVKRDEKYPFSKGIMARSIAHTGISIDSTYQIVYSIMQELENKRIKKIKNSQVAAMVSSKLKENGYHKEEKYYRITRKINKYPKPIFILIGGGSGVGKSTISSDIGHKLNISRVIGSDTIREIMRSMLSENIVPALHQSSFEAGKNLKSNLIDDKVIYGFEQQANAVMEGIISVINRGIKEGLNMIINGVHIVPSFISKHFALEDALFFNYILDVDEEKHKKHFHFREAHSKRSPEHYLDNFNKIERIQKYLLLNAEKNNVKVIKNVNYNATIKIILNDIIDRIEKEMDNGS